MIGYQILKLSSGDDVICNVVSDIEDKLKIFEEVINFNLLDNTKSKTIQ